MSQQPVQIPRMRYLCGIEESWDQSMYVYPLREEDSGWMTMKRRIVKRSARRNDSKKPSSPLSANVMSSE